MLGVREGSSSVWIATLRSHGRFRDSGRHSNGRSKASRQGTFGQQPNPLPEHGVLLELSLVSP